MLCSINGKQLIQAWNIKKNRWDYIPIKKWYFMSAKQRNKYDV